MTVQQYLKTRVILPVSDIHATIDWYAFTLGFETSYIHGHGRRGEAEDFANYAIMYRDAVEVHFILDENGPIWTRSGTGHLGLTVRDVDLAYAEVQSRGARIERPLGPENWPARGFLLLDPSGNHVHIEQPISVSASESS